MSLFSDCQVPRQAPGHNADETEPMELRMKSADGYEIWLDDKRMHHVESFVIESTPYKDKVELSIKMLAKYAAT